LWGFALTIAIYTTASISTAHLNPAVSVAMRLIRGKEFSLQYCAAYILAQLSGSFFAALVNWWIFLPHLREYEGKLQLYAWVHGCGKG
jgi:glycerol uptake facilitator protein